MASSHPMGRTATGDLSSQAPWLGPRLLSSCWSAPLPRPRNQHSHGQTAGSHVHGCAYAGLFAWNALLPHPPPNFMKILLKFHFLRATLPNSFPPDLIPLPTQSSITSSVCLHLFLLLSVSCTCHLFYVTLTDYGNSKDQVLFSLRSSDMCPSHNTCAVNICWVTLLICEYVQCSIKVYSRTLTITPWLWKPFRSNSILRLIFK